MFYPRYRPSSPTAGQSPVPGTPGGAVPASQPQESYLLAQLEGQEALVGAVMEAALGPSPLDPDMAAEARRMLLLPVYGHTVRRDTGVPYADADAFIVQSVD